MAYKKGYIQAGEDVLLPVTTADQVMLDEGKSLSSALGDTKIEDLTHYGDFEILWSGNANTEQNLRLSKPMSEFRYLWFVVGHAGNGGQWMNTRLVPVEMFKVRFNLQNEHYSFLFDTWDGGYLCMYSPDDNNIHIWNFSSGNTTSMIYIGGIK